MLSGCGTAVEREVVGEKLGKESSLCAHEFISNRGSQSVPVPRVTREEGA